MIFAAWKELAAKLAVRTVRRTQRDAACAHARLAFANP
jgi:hypothetical protein